MGQERFRIKAPTKVGDTYDPDDFERWRTELFAQVEVSRTVDFLTKLTRPASPHHFDHIGLSAWCRCGWEERKFWSETAARLAWWEHARDLLDWDALEAEHVMAAVGKLLHR